jgi:hypothetical protein
MGTKGEGVPREGKGEIICNNEEEPNGAKYKHVIRMGRARQRDIEQREEQHQIHPRMQMLGTDLTQKKQGTLHSPLLATI